MGGSLGSECTADDSAMLARPGSEGNDRHMGGWVEIFRCFCVGVAVPEGRQRRGCSVVQTIVALVGAGNTSNVRPP